MYLYSRSIFRKIKFYQLLGCLVFLIILIFIIFYSYNGPWDIQIYSPEYSNLRPGIFKPMSCDIQTYYLWYSNLLPVIFKHIPLNIQTYLRQTSQYSFYFLPILIFPYKGVNLVLTKLQPKACLDLVEELQNA